VLSYNVLAYCLAKKTMSMSTWSERSAESGTVGQWNLVVVTGDVVLWHGTLTGASHWLRASLKEVVA